MVDSFSLNKRIDFLGVWTTEWGTVKALADAIIKKRMDNFIVVVSGVYLC